MLLLAPDPRSNQNPNENQPWRGAIFKKPHLDLVIIFYVFLMVIALKWFVRVEIDSKERCRESGKEAVAH